MRICLLFAFFFEIVTTCNAQSLFINEFMSSNSSFTADEDGDFSDWVEVFNGGSEPIQLSDYSLSDDGDNLSKWSFPDLLLSAGQYLVVFASGKDRAESNFQLHTNFSIGAAGENLYLSNNGVVESVTNSVALDADMSFGLYPDGSSITAYFDFPTPGLPNNNMNAASIEFSQSGGYFSESFYLELSTAPSGAAIFFTINGEEPDINSEKYEKPLFLDHSFISPDSINQFTISPDDYYYYPESQDGLPKIIVLRAAVFDDGGNQLSEVVTHSYLIESLGFYIPQLPIVSLCGNHYDFFDYDHGILVPGVHFDPENPFWTGNYYQRGNEWERDVNVECFIAGKNVLNQSAGVRTHGGNGRRHTQKSLRLYARAEYGLTHFEYPFFEKKSIEKFKRLVLKPFSSSWSEAGIEDQVASEMASELNVDFTGSETVVLFLNGEYWGIYFLQERIDERYIEENYSTDRDCVEMIENWYGQPVVGSNNDFLELYDFVELNDMAFQPNFEYVAEKIDLENFIDYQLFEIFIANYDWPANNMKCWKSPCYDNQWRWIFFDGDGALGSFDVPSFSHALSTNHETWSTNPRSTLFLRKLIENDTFLDLFLTRLELLTTNQFSYENTSQIYDSIRNEIDDELPLQTNRFRFPASMDFWLGQMENINEFLNLRPCEYVSQAEDRFEAVLQVVQCLSKADEIIAGNCGVTTFPNPSNGEFFIFFDQSEEVEANVKVVDLMGRTVYDSHHELIPGMNNFNLAGEIGPAKGVYIISVELNNCLYQTKQVMVD